MCMSEWLVPTICRLRHLCMPKVVAKNMVGKNDENEVIQLQAQTYYGQLFGVVKEKFEFLKLK